MQHKTLENNQQQDTLKTLEMIQTLKEDLAPAEFDMALKIAQLPSNQLCQNANEQPEEEDTSSIGNENLDRELDIFTDWPWPGSAGSQQRNRWTYSN